MRNATDITEPKQIGEGRLPIVYLDWNVMQNMLGEKKNLIDTREAVRAWQRDGAIVPYTVAHLKEATYGLKNGDQVSRILDGISEITQDCYMPPDADFENFENFVEGKHPAAVYDHTIRWLENSGDLDDYSPGFSATLRAGLADLIPRLTPREDLAGSLREKLDETIQTEGAFAAGVVVKDALRAQQGPQVPTGINLSKLNEYSSIQIERRLDRMLAQHPWGRGWTMRDILRMVDDCQGQAHSRYGALNSILALMGICPDSRRVHSRSDVMDGLHVSLALNCGVFLTLDVNLFWRSSITIKWLDLPVDVGLLQL